MRAPRPHTGRHPPQPIAAETAALRLFVEKGNGMANDHPPEVFRPDSSRDDVRYLGRILGDVIREQEGDAFFDLTERIRQASVAYHRSGAESSGELEALLDGLSLPNILRFVRGFTSFAQ